MSQIKQLCAKALYPLRWAAATELKAIQNREGRDIGSELQRRALASTASYVERKLSAVNSVESDEDVLKTALGLTRKEGLYLEFGVNSGRTINIIAAACSGLVYGFDSFEGLPERWRDGFGAGHFKRVELPRVAKNVRLVKGWFDQTLPTFLSEHSEPVAFLHVDCDLYSSTQTIFKLLRDRLKSGAIIVLDEYFNYAGWEQGEYKAFQEFLATTGHAYDYICYNRTGEQVCVRLR